VAHISPESGDYAQLVFVVIVILKWSKFCAMLTNLWAEKRVWLIKCMNATYCKLGKNSKFLAVLGCKAHTVAMCDEKPQ
jgi:hypothetical protein